MNEHLEYRTNQSYQVAADEGGDIGLFITLVPKVLL